MKTTFTRKWLSYVALLIWLFASSSGMHGHYCFDGIEPTVSVHFDMLNEHPNEGDLSGHKDLDTKPAQNDVLKISNPDLLFLAATLFFAFALLWFREQGYSISNIPSSWLVVTKLRPPLRAPPTFSR